jgi:hypothetical protein
VSLTFAMRSLMDPPAEKNSVFATGDRDDSHQPTVVHDDADRATHGTLTDVAFDTFERCESSQSDERRVTHCITGRVEDAGPVMGGDGVCLRDGRCSEGGR